MNTSPRRNIETSTTIIACMTMKALENELDKGQKNGDATKVITSGEIERIDEFTPRIEAGVGTHTVSLDDNCRKLENGQIMNIKIKKEQREMQLARIREQNEASLENDDFEK